MAMQKTYTLLFQGEKLNIYRRIKIMFTVKNRPQFQAFLFWLQGNVCYLHGILQKTDSEPKLITFL
jgi:hypothetical protein